MSDDLLRLSGVVAGYGGGDVLQGVEIGVPEGVGGVHRRPERRRQVHGPEDDQRPAARRGVARSTSTGERIDRAFAPPTSCGRGISQVPQSDALFPHMTVRENVLLGAYIIRRQKALVRERYDQVGRRCSRSSPSAATSTPATCPAASAGWWSSPDR